MKVALVGPNPNRLEDFPVLKSIQRVFENLLLSLESEAEVVKGWENESDLFRVDAIVGSYEALRIRHNLHLDIPVLIFTFGDMPNGGLMLLAYHGLLRPYDCLAFSCSSDLIIFDRLVKQRDLMTEVIPFPVNCDVFSRRSVNRESIRRKYGISEKGKLLFYAGRVSLQKNLYVLIRIFEEVTKEREAVLCIAGAPDQTPLKEFGVCGWGYAHKLKEAVRKRGLADKVIFVGYLDDNALVELYSASDLFINPTLHHDENFGFSQVEAQSCGLPVVASKWGGIKDTVLHGETGFLMETILTDNGPRLEWRSGVKYILNLLSDDDILWRRMSDRCRTHVLSTFSIKAVGKRIKSTLEEMISIKRKVRPTASPVVRIKDEIKSYIIGSIKLSEEGKLRYHNLPVAGSKEARWFYKIRMEPYSSTMLSKIEDIDETVRPYKAIDLEVDVDKGIIKLLDLMWPGEIRLDPSSLTFLLLSNGERCVAEICDRAGISRESGIRIFRGLIRKGLILYMKEGGG
ncbi:glycosyltransferase family 4 protein [Candidatus Poribacteria bacterium]|nr:glycosyltransferase family 4 protein [Candidatus Poribacteria bacterium]